jgi:hypothetical protein
LKDSTKKAIKNHLMDSFASTGPKGTILHEAGHYYHDIKATRMERQMYSRRLAKVLP